MKPLDAIALEKELNNLIEKMVKDPKDMNSKLEYLKLFNSISYLEHCGFVELDWHKNGTYDRYKDFEIIAEIRLLEK